ncbi:lipoprotein [Mycoplasmopsis californica]|uniref:Lipoprotein n=1 Tax=Mycoplasmopsis californica TaxID=2113 RepID=A0A059XR49_9BACT|nr:S41 family peptidase [Mycoplasmopsis californica]AIA29243.1 lipoprotein [Mycoplasmopsis californica]
MFKIKFKKILLSSSLILPAIVSVSCFNFKQTISNESQQQNPLTDDSDKINEMNNSNVKDKNHKPSVGNSNLKDTKPKKTLDPTKPKKLIPSPDKGKSDSGTSTQTNKEIFDAKKEQKFVDQTVKNTLTHIDNVALESVYEEQNNLNNNVRIPLYRHNKNQDVYVSYGYVANLITTYFLGSNLNNAVKTNESITYNIDLKNRLIFNEKTDKIQYKYYNNLFLKPDFSKVALHPRLKFESWNHFLLDNPNELREINLGKYNIDLIVDQGEVYIPLSVLNLIFLSNNYFNLQFNGSKILVSDNNARVNWKQFSGFAKFYDLKRFNSENLQQRKNNYNFLALMFDYFYGIKNDLYERYNVKNFYELAESLKLKDALLSTDFTVYNNAYQRLWNQVLNDLHSTLLTNSYYRKNASLAAGSHIIPQKSVEASKTLEKIIKLRQNTLSPNGHFYSNKITHIIGDTARIIFNQFHHLPSMEIERKYWPFYDSFYLFKDAIKQIRADDKENKVKNIIIDISINGGGSSLAMQQVAGFLSNKPIHLYIQNNLANQYTDMKFRVDTNEDNQFNGNDGFPEYNWYILTGRNTFSAANLFAHWAKVSGTAKIIGNRSGGGMYAIMPTVLPDGTNVNISSVNAWIGGLNYSPKFKKEMPYTENGVPVDYTLSYDDYYKDNILELMKPVN